MATKLLKWQQNEAREIVKQIFNLALAVNPNDTTQDKTGNKPTVFVKFSGHVAAVDVEIYLNGWDSGACAEDESLDVIRYTIYLDDEDFIAWDDEYEPYPEEKECEELSMAKAALAELKRIAEEWGVEYV